MTCHSQLIRWLISWINPDPIRCQRVILTDGSLGGTMHFTQTGRPSLLSCWTHHPVTTTISWCGSVCAVESINQLVGFGNQHERCVGLWKMGDVVVLVSVVRCVVLLRGGGWFCTVVASCGSLGLLRGHQNRHDLAKKLFSHTCVNCYWP